MSRLPEKILKGTPRVMPIEILLQDPIIPARGEERHLLCWILPPWQRPEVWDQQRKRAFIEGIFLGLGTGTYVVHQQNWSDGGAEPMSGWLIDGQQRISAIRDFVQGDLSIFDGLRFSDLSVGERRTRFLHIVFPSIELEYQPDEQRLKELYLRLNFGGMPHTAQDMQRLTSNPGFEDGIDEVKLAARFVDLLVKEIGVAALEEVVEHNAAETNPSVCHSHDFCDANMVMAVAWHETVGGHFEVESEIQTGVWNRAWSLAKEMLPQQLEAHRSEQKLRPRQE